MDQIQIEMALDKNYLVPDELQKAYLMVKLTAPELVGTKRPKQNLSFVIDRSGSMHGDKLDHTKKAVAFAVGHLGNEDLCSVIAFDDEISVVVPQHQLEAKDVLKRQIQAICSGGTTNLSGGMLTGFKEVKKTFLETQINRILGVFKAYSTRVGEGPLPTELKDKTGDLIRERAHEYGTTTGRPRRCGWFDAVAARFSTRINGFTDAAITRLDILDTLPSLKICIGYELNGKRINYFPASVAALEKCQPVYEELPGWQTPTTDIREPKDLPPEARQYLNRLEELIACPISLVSVGAKREQIIELRPLP